MCSLKRVGMVILLVAGLSSSWAQAQDNPPQRGRFQGGFGQGGFGGGGEATGLLMMEQVQKELELVDDQLEKIRTIQREAGEQMRGMFEGMRDLSDEERRERFTAMQEKMQEANKATAAKVDEVLMPHQRDRLKQIGLQMQMRRGGGAANADAVARALGLTDAQRDELREKEQKVAADLRAKIEAAQKEARGQLLEVLTAEQRAKLEEMLGEPFEIQFGQAGPGGRRGGQGRGGEGGGAN